jgi:hypothetical protein
MAYVLNPITGKLDIASSGGTSAIDAEVSDPTALPITLGTPAIGAVYLANASSGVWLINYKPAGLYRRSANAGAASDWTYLGPFDGKFTNDVEITGTSYGVIQQSPNGSRWRHTPSNEGLSVWTPLAALFFAGMLATGHAQVKALGTDTNGTVISGRTNVLTFSNAIAFTGNAGATTRTNLLGADWATATDQPAGDWINAQTVSYAYSLYDTTVGDVSLSILDGIVNLHGNANRWKTELFSNGLTLPSASTTNAGDLYRVTNQVRFRDSTNTERILLNNLDNLANLANYGTARTNLIGTNDGGWRSDLGLGTTNTPTFAGVVLSGLTNSAQQVAIIGTNGAVSVGSVPSGAAASNSILMADGSGSSVFVASRVQLARLTNDVFKTNNSDQNASSNNVTNWSVSLDANSVYAFRWNIQATCGAEGVNVLIVSSVNTPTNTAGVLAQTIGRVWRPNFSGADVYVTGFGGGQLGGNILGSGAGYGSATTAGNFAGLGQIRTGVSNSVLNVRFCQNSASNVTTTIHSNSIIQVEKLWP